MNTGILIVAHAPLASALRACVLHVFPDSGDALLALDVPADEPPEQTQATVQGLLTQLGTPQALILTDVFGATPCNVAQKVADGVHSKLVAGANLPMLLRLVNYQTEALDVLVNRAVTGGAQGIMSVAVTAPQNQVKKIHDQSHHHHHQ